MPSKFPVQSTICPQNACDTIWMFMTMYDILLLGMTPWYGIDGLRFVMIGMPVSPILMVVVLLMTKEPDQETQDMVDAIRVPKGKAVLAADH